MNAATLQQAMPRRAGGAPADGWWPRLLALLVLLGTLALLTGCAGLPPRPPVVDSQVLPAASTAPTRLGRIAEATQAAARQAAAPQPPAGPSGFRLLPTGEYAFDARAALAALAERSIDAQYYELHADGAGAAFLRSLRDAARRGVRVRLLVDDFHAGPAFPLLRALAREPRVEVRLFNPLLVRTGSALNRLLWSAHEFGRVNRRMHNKLFVADNQVAIYGGRNVADEYFMRGGQANFIDLDVLSIGPVVPALSATFDAYWNSTHAWPVDRVPGAGAEAPAHGDDPIDRLAIDTPLALQMAPTDPLGQTSVRQQLAEGRFVMRWGSAEVTADPPSKVSDPIVLNQPSPAMRAKLDVVRRAEREVAIVNPYFVPGEVGMAIMAEAARRQVRGLIFTNSLGSTDEPLVHRAYARYRSAMLKLGMQLYELNPEHLRESGQYGDFGRSAARLHVKGAVVDRRWLLVGSVNLDARSAIINTELAVVIDCPEITRDALAALGGDPWRTMYRVTLDADGERLRWQAINARGDAEERPDEPQDTPWQRLVHWLQSLFIPEDQL